MTTRTETALSDEELAGIERLLAAANVTDDRPWELYCDHDRTNILEHHTMFGGHSDEDWGPCRITTGDEFDEHAAAELAAEGISILPRLVASLRAERAARGQVEAALNEAHEAWHGPACSGGCEIMSFLRAALSATEGTEEKGS